MGPHFSYFGSYITRSFMWNTYGLLSKVINIFVVIEIFYIHLLSTNSVQINVSIKNYNYKSQSISYVCWSNQLNSFYTGLSLIRACIW